MPLPTIENMDEFFARLSLMSRHHGIIVEGKVLDSRGIQIAHVEWHEERQVYLVYTVDDIKKGEADD